MKKNYETCNVTRECDSYKGEKNKTNPQHEKLSLRGLVVGLYRCNIFKELKKTMSKELKKGILIIFHR